jgi:hypothetical protein
MEISIFLFSKYIFRHLFLRKNSYSLLIKSSEILLLKRLISNQVSHLIENIPQTDSIDVNLKFISDEEQFQKAVNQTFGRFFTHKELKLSYLNNLTNSSSNTIINPNFELNATIQSSTDHRFKAHQLQLQKQYALNQQNPRTDSNGSNTTSSSISNTNCNTKNSLEQEINFFNILNGSKKQQTNFKNSLTSQQYLQLQQYIEQNNISALSPSDSSNDEWSGGVTKQQISASNFGVSQYDEVSVNQVVSKMHHQIISPAQSNESSSSNGQSQWHNGKLKIKGLKLI